MAAGTLHTNVAYLVIGTESYAGTPTIKNAGSLSFPFHSHAAMG